MISFQWFQLFIAVSKFEISVFLCDVLKSICWSTSSPRAIGLPEQDFVGCFVMTCQTKALLAHDGGEPWW